MGKDRVGNSDLTEENGPGWTGNLPQKAGTATSSSSTPNHMLGCPFFKRDPQRHSKHRSCTGPGWRTIHRVKYDPRSPVCPLQQLTAPLESTSTDSTRWRYTAIVVVSLSPRKPSLQPILGRLKHAHFEAFKSPMVSTRTKNGCLNESGNRLARKVTSGRKYTRSYFQTRMKKTSHPHVGILWLNLESHLRLG